MIRLISEKDLDQVVLLEKELFGDDSWDKETFFEQINNNPYASIYIFEENYKIIGYVDLWIAYENADLANIGVSKQYQGKGIGSQLMQFCERIVNQNKCENYSLEVRVSNIKAIHLYEKFGFQIVGVRKNYYANGENAYLMIRK
jgi:[ribosomal protein S18]-alanine N-acetyltransferase